MMRKKIFAVGALFIASLGLGACADQYAYGRAPGYGYYDGYGGGYTGWDQYYGDPFGWQRVPVGFIGNGFGWSGGYYYPGNGVYVYDRRGQRRAWNQQQRAYWQPRVAARQQVIVRPGVLPGQVRQGQVVRQQGRVIRQQGWAQRQEGQIQRQERRAERQARRPQSGWQEGARQERRVERQAQRPQSAWQGGTRQGSVRQGGERRGGERRWVERREQRQR